jgi:Ca2+/H+ antiporter
MLQLTTISSTFCEGGSLTLVINIQTGSYSTVSRVCSSVFGIFASLTMVIQYLPQLWVTWKLKVSLKIEERERERKKEKEKEKERRKEKETKRQSKTQREFERL